MKKFYSSQKVIVDFYSHMDYARTNKLFSKEELAALSKGDSQNLIYDISQMDPRDFFPLIRSIQRYGHNHIFSLTFTLDHYYDYCWIEYPNIKTKSSKRRHKHKTIPFTLANSAYRKIPNTIRHIINMLGKVLSESTTLSSLKFRSVIFSQRDKELLFQSFSGSNSLRRLYFENVNINDEGFGMLVKCLKHPGVTILECRQCGLTDMSSIFINQYLNYHMLLQLKGEKDDDHFLKSVCIRSIDLRDNLFGTKVLLEIADILADLPISLIDLRNNSLFDERIVSNIRRSAPHVEIRIGSDRSNFAPSRKRSGKQSSSETRSNSETDNDTTETEVENGEEIELAPDIRIKGSRAREFVDSLEQIIKLGEELAKLQENDNFVEIDAGNYDNYRSPSKSKSPRKEKTPIKKRRRY